MATSFDPLGQIANGLYLHSRHMQIIGDNINQIHSVGAKQMRPEFRSQIRDAGLITTVPNPGGANIGGVTSTTRQDILRQGQIAQSQRPLDLALNGQGFFLVENRVVRTEGGLPASISLTRNGQVDRLVVPEGSGEVTYLTLGSDRNFLLGWLAEPDGSFNTGGTTAGLERISIYNQDQVLPPQATTEIITRFNLDISDTSGIPTEIEYNYYDAAGELKNFKLVLERVGDTYEWNARFTPPDAHSGEVNVALRFDGKGRLVEPDPGVVGLNFVDVNGVGQPISFDFRGSTNFESLGTPLLGVVRDGAESGQIQTLRFDKDATLIATYTNGRERPIARLAIGDVRAREKLIPESDLKWRLSADSGELQVLDLEQDGRAQAIPSSVEYANMDLADLFSDMIVSQRIYGALSKSLQAVDELTATAIETKA